MDIVFKALADQNRRKILTLLKKSDLSVNQILTHFKISQPSLSHHLMVLKRARLVLDERKGQNIVYSLNTSVFEDSLKIFMDIFGVSQKES